MVTDWTPPTVSGANTEEHRCDSCGYLLQVGTLGQPKPCQFCPPTPKDAS